MPDPSDLLDVDEVAELVGVSVFHLRNLHGAALVLLSRSTPDGLRWRRSDVESLSPFEVSSDAEAGGNELVEV